MREPLVFLNGAFLSESETRVPLLTHCLNYGTGFMDDIPQMRQNRLGEIGSLADVGIDSRVASTHSTLRVRKDGEI